MNALRYLRTVLWSFVGLGRRENAEELARAGGAVPLLLVAFGVLAVVLAGLIGLAKLASGWQ